MSDRDEWDDLDLSLFRRTRAALEILAPTLIVTFVIVVLVVIPLAMFVTWLEKGLCK